jgi:hypothetical protein
VARSRGAALAELDHPQVNAIMTTIIRGFIGVLLFAFGIQIQLRLSYIDGKRESIRLQLAR